jgi:outer membrane receptor protein involved in Fe transport
MLGALLALLFAAAAPIDGAGSVAGTVVDETGAPVAGALVTLSPGRASTRTDRDGRFTLPPPGGPDWSLLVEASGFRPAKMEENARPSGELAITLVRIAFFESVSAAAARAPRSIDETPESAIVLSSDQIAATASPPLDQVLRQVPGFTLFRRTDSRTANPTAQGASLRGVGGSGASRAAVLDDGIPLNDPFGGWVYWARVPLLALDRAETVRGGMSGLYGGPALAGLVHLFRRDEAVSRALLEGSFGGSDTAQGAFYASGRLGPWGGEITGEKYRTNGYAPVAPEDRGPVDKEANSRHETLDVTLGRALDGNGRAFLRGATYDEARQNGTALQTNDTRIGQVAGGADATVGGGSLSARAFWLEETYHQTFSAISADRTSETLTRAQRVPSTSGGFSLHWSRALGASLLVAGVDGGQVHGSSDEDVFTARGVSFSGSSGSQRSGGVFLEDLWTPTPRLSVDAGLRWDGWRNFDAQTESGPTEGSATVRPLPDRSETSVDPHLAVLYRLTSVVSLTASGYRSFRAPTLNELYRPFRVGNVVTDANENLSAERASGFEAGAIGTAPGGRAEARANLFWMVVKDTIANVTISSTPALITRQRQNLGRTRSRGIELDLSWRPADRLTISGGYLFADSTVLRFEADPTLEGRRIPQVPRHQATIQVSYGASDGPRIAFQALMTGLAYDDDQNTLPLAGYAAFDVLGAVPITSAFELFAAVENLFDKRYDTGLTPVRTIGPPRFIRGGVRVRVP